MSQNRSSPLKTIMKTISQSPIKNSPAKLALRLTSMKMTLDSYQKSPKLTSTLKRISYKEEEELKPDELILFIESLKTNDLSTLLQKHGYRQEACEKIQKILDFLDIKDLKKEKDQGKLREFLETDLQEADILNFVVKKHFENPQNKEIAALIKYCKTNNLQIDDSNLESKIRKSKKGEELANLLREHKKLANFRKLISLRIAA